MLRTGGKVILVDGDFAHPNHDYQCSGREDHDDLIIDLKVVRETLEAAGFVEIYSKERFIEQTPVKMTIASKAKNKKTFDPHVT